MFSFWGALMKGDYRFLRTIHGLTAFASVAVQSHPHDHWEIVWSQTAQSSKDLYVRAIEIGVDLASRSI
jgi:hypothetical protein